jgi:hypothetical protein
MVVWGSAEELVKAGSLPDRGSWLSRSPVTE